MKSLWDEPARREIVERVERVAPDARPLWGKMNAPLMLSHLAEAMKMSIGERSVKGHKLPIRYFPLKQLAIYVLPFAKGLPTAPELLEGTDVPADDSKRELRRLVDAFARTATFPEHPAFGRLSRRAWGVLAYRHMDHHLRQFGV